MPYAGVGLGTVWTQLRPPKNSAAITADNLPPQHGKVFVVTGGSSGVGLLLAKELYKKGGRIYVLSRSREKALGAFQEIRTVLPGDAGERPDSGGLEFIQMDLEDLESVQKAAKVFRRSENRLDVLFNIAETEHAPAGRKTKQGFPYHLGVNNIGHVLLEKLLKPILTETAKITSKGTVRVIWPTSVLVELRAPRGGIRIDGLDGPRSETADYAVSKTANWFAASEISRRTTGHTGVLNIAGNPGCHAAEASPWYLHYPFRLSSRDPIHSVETFLWMAFSGEVTVEDAVAGRYAICDGRWHPGQRQDLLLALKRTEEGGTGEASAYMDWCEQKIAPFVTGVILSLGILS
jgi:NAD(P)-dependent dehydrogenase (short-subunit alcohol dehydrogenase family)